MPPEAEWVRNWATTARRDLLAAERLLREPPVFADIVSRLPGHVAPTDE